MTEADRLAAHADIPHALAEVAVMVCNVEGYSLRSIRGGCRRRDLFRIRRNIARRARAMGFSLPQIGRALNRDHTTIISALASPTI